MTKNISNTFSLHEYTIPTFCDNLRKGKVMVTEIEADYNYKRSTLLMRGTGGSGKELSLTPSFLASIQVELNQFIDDYVIPLIRFTRHNFTLKCKVDSKGNLLFSTLQITFKIDCKKRAPISIREKFVQVFRIMIPFTEYIDYISIRGGEYEVQVVEAQVNLSGEDLLEVLEMPLSGPTAKEQWMHFAYQATSEAKKEYKIDVVIPVLEGEVKWDVIKNRTVQQVISFGKVEPK